MRQLVILFTLFLLPATAADLYQETARHYAEALLEHGRDHYGRVHTPLFVHMIDLRALEIPRQRTPSDWRAEMASWKEDKNYLMWGKDRSSVLWAQDSNLLWDTENVRLFYAITKATGDLRFATAADDYLRFFLQHCVSRTTGLFAWGEHIAYNVVDDEIHGKRHELQHADPLWDEMWKFDPGAVRNEIEGLYRYQVTDHRTMAYDRHANYWNGMPERDQATILGYSGTYAEAFAYLAAGTGDARSGDWARKLRLAIHANTNDAGIYPDNWTDRMARELPLLYPARPSIAPALYNLYARTNDMRWLDDANRYLEGCEHELDAHRLDMADAGGWNSLIQAATKGYLLTGNQRYLDLARRTARMWLARPEPKAQMASVPGSAIRTLVALYRATGEREWLDGARRIADHALATFVHPSGLLRGTAVVDRPDYYDAIQGPGVLALALWELGGVDERARPLTPRTWTGDTRPPAITECRFAEVNDNRRTMPVTVRIADASGISRTTLHYTYGTEIGFADEHPEVRGDTYTFHVAPPGVAFIGDIRFAVEAMDASPNHNRTLTKWRTLKAATREQAVNLPGGGLRFPVIGVAVETPYPPAPGLRATTTRWLPEGVEPPPRGLVSIGRYFDLPTLPATGRLSVSYAPEETWRLIETTLTLACWDGHAWTRVPGELDRSRHRVTAPLRPGRYWTLLGEDRVLWRAPGRETGPAMLPDAASGGFDVLTAVWQPGELLSSSGKPLVQYPVDPPYHPVHNSSSPAVAVMRSGQPPVLLIGAPSAYVYAYTRDGRRLWRTEVGGEILGALAAGRLTAGNDLAVAAAWNGGVAVIDATGRKLWEKNLPQPSGMTPVLVDLDGDGRMEIVINAASRLIALRGDTGAIVWEFDTGAAGLVTPAAGALARGGKPRLVTGDDSGAIYVVDETGHLLWRQTRIYGPREVPEPIDYYAAISEIGLADLSHTGERDVIVATKSGETAALGPRGERLWRFASYERKVGISLNGGARMAFADLDEDGQLEVILSQQDSYVYVLDAAGRPKWTYLGYFWYHNSPAVADLQHSGELDIVFTAPEDNGTYALRSGHKGKPGQAPWPMARGGLERTNCAPW